MHHTVRPTMWNTSLSLYQTLLFKPHKNLARGHCQAGSLTGEVAS